MISNPVLARADKVRHGFFTREGGVSDGLYASLNCGPGSRDDPANVVENRRRVMAALGLAPEALATCYQIHSATAVIVNEAWPDDLRPRADGMATATPGIALGILTADCVPVLFADAEAGVIGAAHAGWRGALGGILESTVGQMCRLGARRAAIVAAVGPCIAQPSYEVGPDLRDAFVQADPSNRVWFVSSNRPAHFRFDLGGYVQARLADTGIAETGDSTADTCADEARFFSYRRTTLAGEPDYGRQLSAIALVG